VTDLQVCDACTAATLFLYGDDYLSLTIVRCTPRTPDHMPHTIKLNNYVVICSPNAI